MSGYVDGWTDRWEDGCWMGERLWRWMGGCMDLNTDSLALGLIITKQLRASETFKTVRHLKLMNSLSSALLNAAVSPSSRFKAFTCFPAFFSRFLLPLIAELGATGSY